MPKCPHAASAKGRAPTGTGVSGPWRPARLDGSMVMARTIGRDGAGDGGQIPVLEIGFFTDLN